MRHTRHYTLTEARALRAWVTERVAEARGAMEVLQTPKAAAAFAAIDAKRGGGWPGREVAEATLVLQRTVLALERADIVVRDVQRGLVDFPTFRGDDEVYLCWLVDEPEIEHWHELDAGFAGRRRIAP